MVSWWEKHDSSKTESIERALYKRLELSLKDSLPEQMLFRAYYSQFKVMEKSLPALIPQVYLHYDPLTVRQLGGVRRLLHQRMDFLMLLPHRIRIVLEVDGQQHYSEEGKPSPLKYAEMVREDRGLRLRGYELFRFGATELIEKETARETTKSFFQALFEKHKVL